jgi:hypothetical protein
LIQELQTINVQLRVITEDNIDQIESMSYSDNIQRLTVDPTMTPQKLADTIKQSFYEAPAAISTPNMEAPSGDMNENMVYPATSPDFEKSPDYPDASPAYVPPSGEIGTPGSMPYVPGQVLPSTPSEPPPSGPFLPTSPTTSPPSPQNPPNPENSKSILDTVIDTVKSVFTPEQKGGSVEDFQLGGKVYYRRSRDLGLPSDHLWNVMKKGAKLITIQSEPNSHFTNPNDYVQIAKCDELIKPDSVMAMKMRQHLADQSNQQFYQQQSAERSMMAHQFMQDQSGPPQINVNPIIKIVNGNDNSTPDQMMPPVISSSDSSSYEDNPFSSLQIQNPMRGGGSNQNVEPSLAPAPQTKTKTIMGGLGDLGGIIINKITGTE